MLSTLEPKDYLSPLGTILAAAIGIVGSWVAFVQDPRRVKSLEFRLKYVEEQLAKLYGPLLGILKESEAAYETLLLALGLPADLPADLYDLLNSLDPERQKLWKALWERHILTYYERALSVIAHHNHLLGPAPPSSLTEFVEHAGELRVRFEVFVSCSDQIGICAPKIGTMHRELPTRLVAEIEAKVYALIELQREYRSRIEGDLIGRRLRRNRFEVEVNRRWRGPYLWAELQVFIERARRGESSLVIGGSNAQQRLTELLVRETSHPNVSPIIGCETTIHLSDLQELIKRDEA